MVEIMGKAGTKIDLANRKIAIGYPSPDMISQQFHQCLVELITQTSRFVPLGLTNAVSSRIAVNRNAIVENARMLGATDILWIDADSKFPVDGLMRLVAHDKDIVCATTCRRRGNDRSPVAVPKDFASITPNQQLVSMTQIGFPFMLTKMSVFDKLDELGLAKDKCYFAEPPRWMMREMDWEAVGFDAVIGEDEYWCLNVLKAGFEIWCDMELTMEIGHIGTNVFYVENTENPDAKVDEVLQ